MELPAEYLIISPSLEYASKQDFIHEAYEFLAKEAAVHFTNNELGFISVRTHHNKEIYYEH